MTQTPAIPAPGAASSNPYGMSLYTVLSPTGAEWHLQTREEADKYEQVRDQYLRDNAFPNVSDLMDLDRLLILETIIYRWSLWLGQGFDYHHARIDESSIKNSIQSYSVEVRQLKLALGIDKATRDKEKGESLADYVAKLLERAKIFGYHRNKQYEQAVTAFWKLRSMVMTYDRCDDEERTFLDLSPESILAWVRESVIADWDAMEEAFRKEQAIWIRDQ